MEIEKKVRQPRGSGFWKFNSSLLEDSDYTATIPSARSRNTGLNFDELVARDLFQECVCVSPSGVAFSI